MITKDKDFTGCHPEIAKALKQNKKVLCWVWDEKKSQQKGWVIDYNEEPVMYKYITNKSYFINAEPVKPKTIVKPFYELVEQLKKDGYEQDKNSYILFKENACSFNIFMFNKCGLEPTEEYEWLPEWLTEVEE